MTDKPTWRLQHGTRMQTWGLWCGDRAVAKIIDCKDGWAVLVRGFWLAGTFVHQDQAMRVAETVAGVGTEVAQ